MNPPIRLTGLALGFLLAVPGLAEAACPPGLPPGVYCGSKDLAAATAGTYAVDPNHTAVIARVSHIGYSYSVFRFGKPQGTLSWDPAAPDRSRLNVTVETASIATPVPGFAAQLTGDEFLKSKTFPQASFVSTEFRRIDATHGKVAGDLTLVGKTRPMSFDVALVGAGKGFGQPRIGVEARGQLDPKAFGLSPMLGDRIELVIDAEFERKP
ncbi:MAG: YceI family protein [Caulobacteraceae bacterium]